jgi:hypothetical protein
MFQKLKLVASLDYDISTNSIDAQYTDSLQLLTLYDLLTYNYRKQHPFSIQKGDSPVLTTMSIEPVMMRARRINPLKVVPIQESTQICCRYCKSQVHVTKVLPL